MRVHLRHLTRRRPGVAEHNLSRLLRGARRSARIRALASISTRRSLALRSPAGSSPLLNSFRPPPRGSIDFRWLGLFSGATSRLTKLRNARIRPLPRPRTPRHRFLGERRERGSLSREGIKILFNFGKLRVLRVTKLVYLNMEGEESAGNYFFLEKDILL